MLEVLLASMALLWSFITSFWLGARIGHKMVFITAKTFLLFYFVTDGYVWVKLLIAEVTGILHSMLFTLVYREPVKCIFFKLYNIGRVVASGFGCICNLRFGVHN